MNDHNKMFRLLILIIIIIVSSQLHHPCSAWFFSSSKQANTHTTTPDSPHTINHVGAEFALDSLDNDQTAMNYVENAKLLMRASESCWVNAYQNLFGGSCTKIAADQDFKDRLTWDLSNCFQKHSGRPPFPYCDPKYPTKNCLKHLDNDAHNVFLQYFLQIDSICHHLQIHAFKHQTERLVNELKRSAEYAEDKLHTIEERGEILLQNSKHIHSTMASIDQQTQQVVESSRDLHENVKDVQEKSKVIAAAQEEVIQGQTKMRERLNEGMAMLHDSYTNLAAEILILRDETGEIEKEIGQVGEAMFARMTSLQNKADDIQNLTGTSLDNQKNLLETQSAALEGLRLLTTFQSQALEESRGALQKLSEFGKRQQEELLNRQQELQRAHNQLAENSKTILAAHNQLAENSKTIIAAQEAFESKQAGMLNTLDKLFAVHNAMLIESRSIKVFIIYSLLMLVLYMFTSMKQTYNIRLRLYLGLFASFLIELCTLQCTTSFSQHQTWMLNLTRSVFLGLALIQIAHSIFTYKDYEVLNHDMLLRLVEKMNGRERNDDKELEEESEVEWSSWIDEDLKEDVGALEDPDYHFAEQVEENSVETSSLCKRYNLRSRQRYLQNN